MTALPINELDRALERLTEAELIFRRGGLPKATYVFKHALIQDAAYQSQLKSRRQQLHARIARVLEQRFPEVAEGQPEVLARHCAEAGLTGEAVNYRHKAGRLAIQGSAMAEAVAHLTKALELLAGLADGWGRRQREFELQLTLGVALNAAKGWGSLDMGRAYARARELGRELGDSPQLFPALLGLWYFHENRAELESALEIGKELLGLAHVHGDEALELLGHRAIGNTLFFLSEFDAALPHLEKVIDSYIPLKHSIPLHDTTDTRVSSRIFASWTLLMQGYLDRALRQAEQALALGRELARPYNLAYALHVNCVFHQIRGDPAVVEELSAALVSLAAEQDFPHFLGTGAFFRGWARSAGGDADVGVQEMHRGLTAKRATGAELKVPYYLGVLAEVHVKIGRPAEALPLLAEALETVERTGERWFEPELYRLKGEALVANKFVGIAEVEAYILEAIELARSRGAKLWELRAAILLARLWRDQGRAAKAHQLLAPVYGWFIEGFDSPDLRAAQALLDELH